VPLSYRARPSKGSLFDRFHCPYYALALVLVGSYRSPFDAKENVIKNYSPFQMLQSLNISSLHTTLLLLDCILLLLSLLLVMLSRLPVG
jgi:hypothetical protein